MFKDDVSNFQDIIFSLKFNYKPIGQYFLMVTLILKVHITIVKIHLLVIKKSFENPDSMCLAIWIKT